MTPQVFTRIRADGIAIVAVNMGTERVFDFGALKELKAQLGDGRSAESLALWLATECTDAKLRAVCEAPADQHSRRPDGSGPPRTPEPRALEEPLTDISGHCRCNGRAVEQPVA